MFTCCCHSIINKSIGGGGGGGGGASGLKLPPRSVEGPQNDITPELSFLEWGHDKDQDTLIEQSL